MRVLACVLALCGCDFDFGFEGGPSTRLYDNGMRLRVTACPDKEFLSCSQTTMFESANAVVDGALVPLPLSSSSAPNDADADTDPAGIPPSLYLSDEVAFATEVASPAQPSIAIEIDGNATTATEPPGFAVDAPATASRSAGPVTVSWGAFANAVTVQLFVVSSCGSDAVFADRSPSADNPGQQVSLDLSKLALPSEGACTHTIEVAQFAWLDADGPAHVGMMRIGLATIASDP